VEVELHAFLTSALDGRKWSVSRPARFTLGEDTGINSVGWVDLGAGLDTMAERRNPYSCWKSNHGLQPVAYSL